MFIEVLFYLFLLPKRKKKKKIENLTCYSILIHLIHVLCYTYTLCNMSMYCSHDILIPYIYIYIHITVYTCLWPEETFACNCLSEVDHLMNH